MESCVFCGVDAVPPAAVTADRLCTCVERSSLFVGHRMCQKCCDWLEDSVRLGSAPVCRQIIAEKIGISLGS
jgi:hypothetical protein